MAEPLLLVGAGGHAKACIDVIEAEGRFHVAGLVGTPDEVGTRVLGHEVIGADADLPALVARHRCALVVVGQIKTPAPRQAAFARLLELGADLPVIVSPKAYVSRHAVVGRGSIVMHGAIVNAAARVGENVILNSLSLVEHDAAIGDHCHISTGARINGGVRIGNGSFVGSGAVIREGLTIPANAFIPMGHHVTASP